MGSSLSPPSVAVLTTAAHAHRCRCAPDDGYNEDDDFEFTPLLLRTRRRRSARTERPRIVAVVQVAAITVAQPQPPQRARRGAPPSVVVAVAGAATAAPPRKKEQQPRVRWHDMAFGTVRVPAATDMGEIRRRLRARQALLAGAAANEPSSAAGWAPWRLIRSLSCKGVEAVAAAGCRGAGQAGLTV